MNGSFWKELWFLMICAFTGIALTSVIVSLFGGIGLQMDATLFAHIMQWMQTLFIMFLPALLWYSWRFRKSALEAFGFKKIDAKSMILTAAMMVCAIPALDFLSVANAKMPMPEFLVQMADEMRVSEEAALANLMNVEGIGGYLELVLLMSVGTAIAEETMFRGALVKCFDLTRLNKHWVAVLVGLIFSAIHFDVYGFFARWILGTLFCYLLFWTKSIWPAILAHAINNMVALVDYWSTDIRPQSPAEVEWSYSGVIYIVSFALATGLTALIVQKSNQKR